MATHGTWHRRGLAIVAATTVIGSITTWATQVAIATPVSTATVHASRSFAGAVTSPPLMKTKLRGGGKMYTESAQLSFIVPTVTCLASQNTTYAIFLLYGQPDNSGYVALSLDCESGRFSAGMFTSTSTENPTSGGCLNVVPVAPGDAITFSEQDSVTADPGQIPLGYFVVGASDRTNEESSGCSSLTSFLPYGPVHAGMCDWQATTGPVTPEAAFRPPTCGSTKVSAFTRFSLSHVKVDDKPFWHWPTNEFDMYRQVGSTDKRIEQVQTERVDDALDFTFLHH
jgi:hypothetical protein